MLYRHLLLVNFLLTRPKTLDLFYGRKALVVSYLSRPLESFIFKKQGLSIILDRLAKLFCGNMSISGEIHLTLLTITFTPLTTCSDPIIALDVVCSFVNSSLCFSQLIVFIRLMIFLIFLIYRWSSVNNFFPPPFYPIFLLASINDIPMYLEKHDLIAHKIRRQRSSLPNGREKVFYSTKSHAKIC